MGFLKKIFGNNSEKSSEETKYPSVPDGMEGVFMKDIGMH